jgi:hypothetical protein
MRHLKKILAGALSVTIVAMGIYLQPKTTEASGGSPGIRQEINIIDGYLGAAPDAFATSSAIVQFDGTKYTAPSAYFEVVASTSASISTQVFLRNATSSATVATINIPTGTTAYTRFRSTEITAMASTTQNLVVVVASTTGAVKGVVAARIVILDSGNPLSSMETQIEIGNQETFTTSATTTFTSPKYWYYNSAGWDGSPTFYAEVTYEVLNGAVASTSSYTSSGTFTVNLPGGTASSTIGLWGGGGSGGSSSLNTGGGSGAAGGQFASSTLAATTTTHTLIVAAGAAAPATPNSGTQGATSTWDGAMIVAGGGGGGLKDAGATTTATSFGCIGTSCFAGGNGANGRNPATEYGGGGGGGADSSGAGNNAAADASAGAAKGYGGAGAVKNVTGATAGTTGGTAGGGGSGGNSSGAADKAGGAGGVGRADIYNYIATTTIALQEDDGAFANWTDKTFMTTSNDVMGAGAIRDRSTAFTPTNGKHYRIALRKNDSRTVLAIYNAKIVVDQAQIQIADSYNESNGDVAFVALRSGGNTGAGQSFTSTGGTLTSAKFYLYKDNSPIGNAVAKLYAITGTSGTDAKPTGAALATSDNFDVSTLTTSVQLISFTFSGANQYAMVNGTKYAITVEYSTSVSPNNVEVYADSSSPTHSGNASDMAAGVWNADVGFDLVFYVYATFSVPTLLEPQYLLANTKLPSGTGLQNYLTSFSTTEWTTTNNYIHAVSAADNSTSVIEIDNTTGPTQITGSVVTSPDNYATSTGMCLTSSAALDTKATTNNGDIYSSSILVQVGVASTASCGGVAAVGPAILSTRNLTLRGSVTIK